ncbi:TetR/AcrR family transcriptional regulator [Halomicroarcula sp. GCM10025709]|uniref:TetR/AcrR family transcriptional regulator n=1 Tax=Haloarcula TaxID=2237 RepID=UPI0024C352BB|nr:TetR/AcrR family transcriptional regulator [Halomicroarcula sp. YJ-61-S]
MGARDQSGDNQPESKDAIMEATFKALSKHGYADLSMQDIADEFDKSRSLLHYHYDTREDLILAFVDDLIGHKESQLARTEAEEPPERLLEYLDQFTLRADHHHGFAVALFELRLQALRDDRLREKLAKHYQRNIETAADIISDGVETGVFRSVDPSQVAETIYNAIQGAAFCEVVLGFEGAIQRMRDSIVEFVVGDLVSTATLLAENTESATHPR